MALNVEEIFSAMMEAGKESFAGNWETISNYAETEFMKMATQIVEIGENVAAHEIDPSQGYDAEAGKILLNMQRLATANVFIAVSAMSEITVRQALDAMFKVVRNAIGGVLTSIL
ncbi:MAG TPA: hypothetical protein VIN57_02190, partial [Magnetovibrio sp.]